MAVRLLASQLRLNPTAKNMQLCQVLGARTFAHKEVPVDERGYPLAPMPNSFRKINMIGNREVVCWGENGMDVYEDLVDVPMPAIRFKEPNPHINALREKEKGDWKKLSIEEKKSLYRFSFCQTYAEMKAPTGEWKSIVGCAAMFISFSMWLYFGFVYFINPPLPESFSEENRIKQFQGMLELDMNPISNPYRLQIYKDVHKKKSE